ncbi:cytochrome o ubiquinol oxidase subunit IV [Falsirhodobacter halotolerans]|uniref:cytochrome o ubiquinol oxidase subunit IV n=1 Tax=Falsirhodobacter halotolerans TaxID=1146892 RepID=UPI001FD48315|nr:cytochrome o ubiquinol oxidase subunit IV [Falsirhodobacter halotolerans]MCJ8138394.1 cytochrome o ubiquinol oxidase subunit IV [Falsirhodobacter halotolerans]
MAHHAHTDGHHDHDAHAHGSFGSYMTGFVLSVILTVIPFWLVMGEVLDSRVATILIVTVLAAVQVIVHVIFFLHVNGKAEEGWLLTSVVFTLVVVVIMIAGSVWVMWNMNANMMPAHDMLLETPQLIVPESAPAQSVQH